MSDGNDLCSCGNRGCLEATIGEPALLRNARELCRDLDLPVPSSPAELYSAAAHLDPLAELLTHSGRLLGRALGNLINLLAPELVVLSGEGVDAGEVLLGAVRTELAVHVHEGLRDTYELMVEPLTDEAWARGAASLILNAVFEQPTRTHSSPLWDWSASQ